MLGLVALLGGALEPLARSGVVLTMGLLSLRTRRVEALRHLLLAGHRLLVHLVHPRLLLGGLGLLDLGPLGTGLLVVLRSLGGGEPLGQEPHELHVRSSTLLDAPDGVLEVEGTVTDGDDGLMLSHDCLLPLGRVVGYGIPRSRVMCPSSTTSTGTPPEDTISKIYILYPREVFLTLL